MANRFINRKSLASGLRDDFVEVFPAPIISDRAPRTSDRAELGTIWVDKPNDDVYVLTSVVANSANWEGTGGGTGSFTTLTVSGTSTLTGNTTVGTGNLEVTAGDFEVTAGAVTIGAFATAGVVINDASGVLATSAGTDGQVIIAKTGAAPVWNTLTAGGGITITEGVGTITIANPGATGTTMTADDTNAVAPDGAGNTDVIGYDANIQTDGATANTLKIRLSDDVTTVGALTAGVNLNMSTGICTIDSDSNGAQAIYLHADAGVNETIDIYSDQGTNPASIYVHSDVGGLTFDSGLASADAININASDAAGGIDVDYGTGGMNVAGANGGFTLTTGTGNIAIGADATDHDIEIGDAAGTNAMALISGTGHTALTSGGNITLDATGTVEINSSAGTLNVGNDADAQNINIGNGAAARTITIGNVTGATALALNAGTGGIALASTGTGDITINSDDTLLLDSDGVLELNSSAGAIGIGSDADAQNINIGTGAAARTITIGNATGATSVVVNSGTGNADFGVNATDHSTRVGGTTGTSALTLQAGTGAFTLTAGGALDANAAGNVTIDSSAGTISIGADDIDQVINIGTDGERTTTIGSNNGAAGVTVDCGTGGASFGATATAHTTTVGSTNTTCDTTIQAGSGAMTFTAGGAFDVNATGNVTIDSSGGTLGLGEDAVTQNINIGTGAAARVITIGNVTDATGLALNSGTAGIAMASTGAGDITINSDDTVLIDADGVLELNSSGGAIGIGSDADAQAINVGTGAAARTITIGNATGGTGLVLTGGDTGDIQATPATTSAAAASATLNAKVGVVTLTGQTTASTAQATLTITNSEVSATSGILVTVANVGTNDARMTLEQVKPAAGSFELMCQNNGAASLNGDIIISFWVLN